MRINSAKDLVVYKKTDALAMQIFELSKSFPVCVQKLGKCLEV